MGYIPPITPFERMQYTNRIQQPELKNVRSLMPALHTKLYVNDEEWERTMKKKEKAYSKVRPTYHHHSCEQSHVLEKIKAEITGKGINFNQVI